MSSYQIFISYRRDGGEFLAGRLSDKLDAAGYSVFYDIESMRSGPFNTQIYDAIDQCDDVLLVLPPNALDRCRDEEDWVRKEIEHAIQTHKNIIPLLMRGFVFPTDLPPSIKAVADYEGALVDSHYFDAMIDKIRSLLRSKPVEPATDTETELIKGIRFLNHGLYAQASLCLENAIQSNVSDPDAYFYAAAAKLEGKRPFLASKTAITEIENYLGSALAYGERGIYYYFLAYVKYDFYARKMLKSTPSYTDLLSFAGRLGITEEEIAELFALLGTQKPDVF